MLLKKSFQSIALGVIPAPGVYQRTISVQRVNSCPGLGVNQSNGWIKLLIRLSLLMSLLLCAQLLAEPSKHMTPLKQVEDKIDSNEFKTNNEHTGTTARSVALREIL